MSNIDKQALLVSKAKVSVFTMGYISQFEASDIDSDDIDLQFEVDGVETGTTVSIVDECGHAAQIITALLDELEAAQKLATQQGNIAVELFDEVTRLQRSADDKAPELREQLEAAERRIAELETRSISLTMPPRKTLDDYINDEFDPSDLAAIYNACRLECEVKFKSACHAAGIAIKG